MTKPVKYDADLSPPTNQPSGFADPRPNAYAPSQSL